MKQIPRQYYENKGFKTKTELRASSRRMIKVESSIDEALQTNQVQSLEQAIDTVDAEKDQALIQTLDIEWLKFAAKVYNISPKIEDYIIVSTIVCPSELPNRNGIAFPTDELVRFQPPPMNRMVYKAWTGCPVHLEHDNEVHERAYGVILDTSFEKVTGYGGGKLWKVMGLLAIDKNKYPDIAQKVLMKEINTYSMGALVDYFQCGYCGTECSASHVCPHISSVKNVNWGVHKDYDGQSHMSFLNAYGISPIECSIVADPAWAPALSDEVWEYKESPKREPDVRKVVKETQQSQRSLFDDFPIKWGQ